jgi:hypothetical protein
MTKYIPFLKFKQNEIQAIGTLEKDVNDEIIPFFDLPRSKKILNVSDIIQRIELGESQISRIFGKKGFQKFYIDNFDIDDDIDINGFPQYRYILNYLSSYHLIPVLAFDRHSDHNNAAIDYISINGGSIALRLQGEDLESYKITKNIIAQIWPQISQAKPKEIHLIIDQRIITDLESSLTSIKSFIENFVKDFHVDLIIITGSTIPSNIADLIDTNDEKHILRKEYHLWKRLKSNTELQFITFGDYGVVSPDYSDAEFDPRLFRRVSTPKVFYVYDDKFYVVRGESFQNHPDGNGQYFDIADKIASKNFYRNSTYSTGDKYLNQ